MNLFIKITMGILAALTVLLPTFWSIKSGGRANVLKRLNKIGWLWLSCIGIYFLLDTYKGRIDDKSQSDIEVRQKNIHSEVKNVGDCMTDASEELKKTYEVTLAMTDSLSRINKSSINLIKNYENSIKKYELLSNQLDEVIKQTNIKIIENKANLLINGNVLWDFKVDSTYSLLINFFNFGKRDCINFAYQLFLIQTDSSYNVEGVDVEYSKIETPIPAGANRSQKKYNYKLSQFDGSYAILYLVYRYEDEIIKKPKVIVQGYVWHSLKRDGLTFLNNDFAKVTGEYILKQKGCKILSE